MGPVGDEDCDGREECADPDCDGRTCGANGERCSLGACTCPGGNTESFCGDHFDDDCDGLIDCQDLDCYLIACDDVLPGT